MAVETVVVSVGTLALTNGTTNYLFDTTAPIGVAPAATYTNYGHGQTAQASLSVGPLRKQYPNLSKILWQISCTTQNVTAYFATLLGGSWVVLNGGGSGDTVTAGTPWDYAFDVNGGEARIYITNGGTGPSALSSNVKLVFNDRGGS